MAEHAMKMLAKPLQHVPPTFIAGLHSACPKSGLAKAVHAALRLGRGGMNVA